MSKVVAIAILCVSAILLFANRIVAQGMQMTEEFAMCQLVPKPNIKSETLRDYFNDELRKRGNFFVADRGKHKGNALLVLNIKEGQKIKMPTDLLDSMGPITNYQIIRGTNESLPVAGILGIHFMKVKPDRAEDFEKFVQEKVHPVVGSLLPDLQLLYYKETATDGTTRGPNSGNYITIFTLRSPGARDRYWPEGKPETVELKDAFGPLGKLAKDLGSYFVEGTYLLPASGGAAAYFESRTWTDFVHSSYLKNR